ncbi:MAG: 1-acyl-sn-glycerol-3-phosphate acyltransferase, partial [candidate division KSB1 bacterium]|nr:1-acyl-sn-glycerol-3-phosphate acyltransferase [candidate division KSB1 bacterium]
EFQPRIVFADQKKTWRKRTKDLIPTDKGSLKVRFLDTMVFAIIKTLAYPVFRYYLGARLLGKENIPRRGPFILIVNHEGYFDSFFLIALLKRKVAFFAKNTEFKSGFFRWILRVFRAIPVRRYEIDPSVIRNAIKLLSQGHPVGIFIEGERTWDGEFLPPKRGVVKFLLRANVPIVPCLIRGSFECMPRWEHRIRRTPVKMVLGKPFKLREKEGDLEEIGTLLMKKIKEITSRRVGTFGRLQLK